MGNIRGFVNNPAAFMFSAFMRKFGKGVGVVALALVIFEAVKFIISEMLKPGRLLDLRFKRVITKEIIAFRRREDQQNLKQGFSNIIITTSPRLRGGQNKFVNTLDLVRNNAIPENIGFSAIDASGRSMSKSKRTHRAGR